ncbi:hypothetical protein RHMOL_Rhmol01G0341300 [Rhododendron molle]|uniref:Uncharacterized protein n=1 Tax=Rhododendron molle TaxID=49168 RepID=A0ACC0Q8B6_RHOML|nr:hypothetical protein RHMOL_Rhmol01G0341300 [Rhododendron molle]
MYADRVESTTRRTIKERLYGNTGDDSGRRRQVTGKRQRQDDDKWEHDLYKDGQPQVSNRSMGVKDLRFKLQKKSVQQENQSGNGSVSATRDLREKLSGEIYLNPVKTDNPKPKPVLGGSKPVKKTVIVEAPEPETKKVASSIARKKTQQKARLLYFCFYFCWPLFNCYEVESVDSFLQSLGLEKYSITFQAEEVDMTALVYMTDEDLKALGVPMGPRKKIILALETRV